MKEISRDYITAAMQLYASEGKPCLEDIKNRGYPDYVRKDLECIEKTMRFIAGENKDSTIRAIERVYFVPPFLPLKREDIANRVRVAATEIPADERSVYRWLKYARTIAAGFRGLRH